MNEVFQDIGSIVLGLGLLLYGFKAFTMSLNQLTSDSVRLMIANFTPNGFVAALWGVVTSALMAGSTTILSTIAGGVYTLGAFDLRKTTLFFIWGRPGSAIFVILAGVNIGLALSILLGIAGIGFAIGYPKRLSEALSLFFHLGLVLLGIAIMRESAADIKEIAFFQMLLAEIKSSQLVSIMTGILLTIFTQGTLGPMMMNVSLVEKDIFSYSQMLSFMFGIYLGNALMAAAHSAAVRDPKYKQVIALRGLFDVVNVFFFAAMYQLDKLMGYEFFAKAFALFPQNPLVVAVLGYTCGGALLFTLALPFLESFLSSRLESGKGSPKDPFLPPSTLHPRLSSDFDMCLALAGKECTQVIQGLTLYTQSILNPTAKISRKELHIALQDRLVEVQKILARLSQDTKRQKLTQELFMWVEKQQLLLKLDAMLFELIDAIDHVLRTFKKEPERQKPYFAMLEALETLIIELSHVWSGESKIHEEHVQVLFASKRGAMTEFRERYGPDFDPKRRPILLRVTHSFENTVWLMDTLASKAQEASKVY